MLGDKLIIKYGVVAQLVEHLTFNQVVGSSSLLSLSDLESLSNLEFTRNERLLLFKNLIKF